MSLGIVIVATVGCPRSSPGVCVTVLPAIVMVSTGSDAAAGHAKSALATQSALAVATAARLAGAKCGRAGARLFQAMHEPDQVAARLLVALECDRALALRLFQHAVERAEAVIRFVEAGLSALQRLLDH